MRVKKAAMLFAQQKQSTVVEKKGAKRCPVATA